MKIAKGAGSSWQFLPRPVFQSDGYASHTRRYRRSTRERAGTSERAKEAFAHGPQKLRPLDIVETVWYRLGTSYRLGSRRIPIFVHGQLTDTSPFAEHTRQATSTLAIRAQERRSPRGIGSPTPTPSAPRSVPVPTGFLFFFPRASRSQRSSAGKGDCPGQLERRSQRLHHVLLPVTSPDDCRSLSAPSALPPSSIVRCPLRTFGVASEAAIEPTIRETGSCLRRPSHGAPLHFPFPTDSRNRAVWNSCSDQSSVTDD